MSSDSVRSDSVNNSDSILPYKNTSQTSGIVASGIGMIQGRDAEVSDTKDAVNSRIAANRSIEGSSGNVEPNRSFPLHAALLLRQAGRCTHESCSATRNRGLEMARAAGFQVPNSMPAPIPSVAVERKYYPEDPVTGKQDRKNVQTYKELKPADPKHPEWVAANAGLTTQESNLYLPEDLLAHHHD
jgi:hypothetical protein